MCTVSTMLGGREGGMPCREGGFVVIPNETSRMCFCAGNCNYVLSIFISFRVAKLRIVKKFYSCLGLI